MTTTEYPLVVGVFRDHTRAAQAIDELHAAGFHDGKIRVQRAATASDLLDGLVCKLTGSEAEDQTLPDELVSKGIPQDEADYYLQEFEAGHSIVIVESYGHQQKARAILRRHGAYDASTPVVQTEGDRTIPVREEVLRTRKELVTIGEVVLHKEVITEEKTITVPITREELVIERRPAASEPSELPVQESELPDEVLKDGETLRIVLHEEQVRVEKYPVVKEEILISKRHIEKIKHVSDQLKREKVSIEPIGNVPIQEDTGDSVSK